MKPTEALLAIRDLDLDGAIDAAHRLAALPRADSYIFDFAELKWSEPSGMAYFGLRLREMRAQQPEARFRAVNYSKHTYPAHMGFFRLFGLRHGNDLGEAPGSAQYIPITSIDISELRLEAASQRQEVQEVIEQRASHFTTILIRESGTDLHNTLSYSLREVLRNSVEHSRSPSLWFAAQYWPSREEVELVVIDEGIGIRQSLGNNPHLTIGSDLEAIELALRPGISGVAYKGAPKRPKSEWANSGYGLFMTSRLCALGGSFVLCSGVAGISIDDQVIQRINIACPGTLLRLKISVPKDQAVGVDQKPLLLHFGSLDTGSLVGESLHGSFFR